MITSIMKIGVSELCEHQGLSSTTLVEMVEYEVLQPIAGSSERDWEFDSSAALWAQRAARLKRDLDLDWVAVAVLIDLLREREHLARENRLLRQRLQRFLLAGE